MKKLLRIIGVMAVVMSLVTTVAFAANSKTVTYEAESVTDANGKAVEVVTAPSTTTISAEKAVETIAEAGIDAKDVTVAAVQDISVPEGTAFPVTITFEVAGINDDQTVFVLHWNGNEWEKVGEGKGSKISAEFTSLSPVALVVENETKSYKTGVANYAPLAVIVALAAMGTACVVYKKEA